jgi:hypothetical protein
MKFLKRSFIPLLAAFSTLLCSGSASATWLGLADGNYDVSLTGCSNANPILCPTSGSLTIGSDSTTFFSFAVNGQLFEGDPQDYVHFGSDRSDIVLVPNSFFSLLYTPGAIEPEVWVYCVNETSNSCRPTVGWWSATLVTESVPEPGTFLLVGLGLFGLAYTRRSRLVR